MLLGLLSVNVLIDSVAHFFEAHFKLETFCCSIKFLSIKDINSLHKLKKLSIFTIFSEGNFKVISFSNALLSVNVKFGWFS